MRPPSIARAWTMRKSASTVRILPFVTIVSTLLCASAAGLASTTRMVIESMSAEKPTIRVRMEFSVDSIFRNLLRPARPHDKEDAIQISHERVSQTVLDDRLTASRDDRAAGVFEPRKRSVEIADNQLKARRTRILHPCPHWCPIHALEFDQFVEPIRRSRHAVARLCWQSGQILETLAVARCHFVEWPTQLIAVERQRPIQVLDHNSDAAADHVARCRSIRRRQRRGLKDLHEMAVRIANDHGSIASAISSQARRHPAGADNRYSGALEASEYRVEISDSEGNCARPRVLHLRPGGTFIGVLELHHLDAPVHTRNLGGHDTTRNVRRTVETAQPRRG